MNLILDRIDSPIGGLLLAVDDEALLVSLEFDDHEPRLHAQLARRFGTLRLHGANAPAEIRLALARYFAGEIDAVDAVRVRMGGTAFQQRCWSALRRIPAGQPVSYGEQARSLGRPTAMRAVGHANGLNPIAIVLPCHRVIGANGALSGYAGGLERKAWLLAHEAAHAAHARARARQGFAVPAAV